MRLLNPDSVSDTERAMIDTEIKVASMSDEAGPIWVGFGQLIRSGGGWYFQRDSRFTEHP